ncbi:protein of unknown function [Paenibacillus alvei]|uniref:Uncharacterized protein n=1 Tax=Paenibacillus alvei TaxID=44250 RepID=A0A383RLI5_PAEAL|nr:protein of unknown function [Paenibacillus alvei]
MAQHGNLKSPLIDDIGWTPGVFSNKGIRGAFLYVYEREVPVIHEAQCMARKG